MLFNDVLKLNYLSIKKNKLILVNMCSYGSFRNDFVDSGYKPPPDTSLLGYKPPPDTSLLGYKPLCF